MKKTAIFTALAAVALAGCSAQNSDFSTTQKAQIEKIASQYIIQHPEVLIKATETLKQQQLAAQNNEQVQAVLQHTKQLLDDSTTPYVGPKDAKVNVIEFFDYNCIFCSKISPVVRDLQKANPDVRFIYKETPIFGMRWESSRYGADMGNWIFAQKGSKAYNTFHNAVYESGEVEGKLTNKEVDKAAKLAGVDVSKFKSDNSFMNNLQLFGELSFRGTPALIVMPTQGANKDNIKIIRGYDPAALKAAIASVKAGTAKAPTTSKS
ncbi:thioredoxin domain-containing protein [Vibrio sp. S4M6]|uniref:DsbA family protein n=1 Tax=Vibrio sinus TaxID=2946865 RepID=UPI00202AAF92|nr:thioredoxin domain-containing protein [Vibrio sinus]MCL9781132.1 thioredoxin domain-containing protein [Vibrio sinus]